MTDEEMAEKYAKEKINDMKVGNFKLMEISHLSNGADIYNPKVEHLLKDKIKQAYLDGLKAGKDMAEADIATIAYMHGAERYKTKWHKVADGDYPPCEIGNYTINVLTDRGDIAYYNYNLDCWVTESSSAEIDPPVAWCKIPKYKE